MKQGGAETFTTSDIQGLSRTYSNIADQTYASDSYFSLSSLTYSTDLTLGTEGVNFLRTSYFYDTQGRQDRTNGPDGTIQQTRLKDSPGCPRPITADDADGRG